MIGGIGRGEDKYHTVNFREAAGESVTVDATSSLAIFVAPVACRIIDISMGVTTSIAKDGTDFWTIQIVNQTGDVDLLSTAFDTDSGNATSANGGRVLTADTLNSLNYNGAESDVTAGTQFLQYPVLAKGDVLVLTATDSTGSAAELKNPVITVHYRV